jgi:hypothetical protein
MISVVVTENKEVITIWLDSSAWQVALPNIIIRHSKIYKWCEENCKHHWEIDMKSKSYMGLHPTISRKFTYYFESQQDAMFFKLRWSGE